VLPGPPQAPSEPVTLAAALAALTHARGSASGTEALERVLALMSTSDGEGPPLQPDAAASLIVLRPLSGDRLEPDTLVLESVFLDGREVGGAR
jgi:hypothetical protein